MVSAELDNQAGNTAKLNKTAGAKVIRVIKSEAPPSTDDAGAMRKWYELKMKIQASRNGGQQTVVADTGAAITMASKAFIKDNFPNAKWRKLNMPFRWQGAGPGSMAILEVAFITLYVPSNTESGEPVFALWRTRVHIIPELTANMPLGMDTLVPRGVVIDVRNRVLHQPMCENVTASLMVESKDNLARKKRKITTQCAVTIPPHSVIQVPLHLSQPLSAQYDYFFEPLQQPPYEATPYAMMM
jgi:hypothetical protein